ncbi:hypothetical protein O181_089439 [Austropuccinia psidii MF-1]|uniref:Uncharacterized protein n=1 Tax=Austropuccinia psidii MF-1 TaxID=1389203 RepID=A0A9Q3P5J4_9BASI|nr:hypothetical protein [Austropuccinia psidii MF-1]
MTPTRSGINYSIQSNGSGPGHSSHVSKTQECQPKGEAQMEDARASTSSQRLDSTFDTLIESPEADITSIPFVRPESFPTGNNRDIPVSVQELVYGSEAAVVGISAKSLDRQNELLSSNKSLVEKPKHVVRGPQEEVGPMKVKQPSGGSPSLQKQEYASTSAKQGQENPKEKSEGQGKGKGTCKIQVEQALPTDFQNSQEREDSHGQCVQYGKNSDGIQKQEEERLNQSFPKK